MDAHTKALTIDGNFVEAWQSVCVSKRKLGDLRGAIEAGKRAVDLGPKSSRPWRVLAQAYHEAVLLDEAEHAYRMAVRLDPKYAKAWDGLGCVLLDKGEREAAIDAFEVALRADPNLEIARDHLLEIQSSPSIQRKKTPCNGR